MVKKFEKIFVDIFSDSYFGKLEVPKIDPKFYETNVQRFVDGILQDNQAPIFRRSLRWNFTYHFLGELYSDFKERGLLKANFIEFDKKNNEIRVDKEVLFSIILLVPRELKSVFGTLQGTGFRDYVKYEDYGLFCKDVGIILSRPDLRRNIMAGRPTKIRSFRSQDEIFSFLKGSLKGKTKQVLEICKAHSIGTWANRSFCKDESAVEKAVELMYSDILKNLSERDFKKKRITKKKTHRYILYLCLHGTIQSRVQEPLNLSARKENEFFTYYKVFRDSAQRLKWMTMTDATFCPNIRCQSFVVSLMCRPIKVKKMELSMNRIEESYINLLPVEQIKFAAQYGIHAIKFLSARHEMKIKENLVKSSGKEIRRLSFLIREFGEQRGAAWIYAQKTARWQLGMDKSMFPHVLKDYIERWSDPRIYDWHLEPKERVA